MGQKWEPDFDEVYHIEDKKKPKSPQEKQMENFLKDMGLDPNMLKSLGNQSDDDDDELMGSVDNMMQEILNKVNAMFGKGNGPIKPNAPRKITYGLGDLDLLKGEDFCSLVATPHSDLLESFKEDNITTVDLFDENKFKLRLSDITSKLPLKDMNRLELVSHNDKYLLFFVAYDDPNDPDAEEANYGFYACVYKDENDEWTFFVPEFGNTFNYENGEVSLYDLYDETYVRETTNGFKFRFFHDDALSVGINWILNKKQNPLMTPALFGTIKKSLDPVNEDGDYIKVGTIISNESADAILFKKDADLDKNETEFPFYIKLKRELTKETLRPLSNRLFDCDWENNPLIYNSDLKYTMGGVKRLYIEIDLGEDL